MKKTVLIVEDDVTFALMLETWLSKNNFAVKKVASIGAACKILESGKFNLILSDLRLPDGDGIDLLSWMNDFHLHIPLIIMTEYANIQSAVLSMKKGAIDYLPKPIRPSELEIKIKEALQNPSTKESNKPPKKQSSSTDVDPTLNPIQFIEGKSEVAKQLYDYVSLVAPTNLSVLIIGASGTGKEHIAKRIHQLSKRSSGAFIAIDCGAIPKELAASEFFGHVKGSFTGAIDNKKGAFLEANGGTIFLDEIGNLSYSVQVQLLRSLQEQIIRPIGSFEEIKIDVRVICATNENLEMAIHEGSFREDLYHRINEFTLTTPSLKDREHDIILFANFFLDQANKDLNKQLVGFDDASINAMLAFDWPGNLRQMKNMVMRATLISKGKLITIDDLGITNLTGASTASIENKPISRTKKNEKESILNALIINNQNKSKAARYLGIDRKTLYNKLKHYNIE